MDKYVSQLQAAISDFRILQLKYTNGIGVVSEREIEPLALYFEQGEWKLIAKCKMRKEKRTFLLKRFFSLELTKTEFAPHQFSLEDYFRQP